ncbi:hypothetical protein Emed_002425 [Eimeria media]
MEQQSSGPRKVEGEASGAATTTKGAAAKTAAPETAAAHAAAAGAEAAASKEAAADAAAAANAAGANATAAAAAAKAAADAADAAATEAAAANPARMKEESPAAVAVGAVDGAAPAVSEGPRDDSLSLDAAAAAAAAGEAAATSPTSHGSAAANGDTAAPSASGSEGSSGEVSPGSPSPRSSPSSPTAAGALSAAAAAAGPAAADTAAAAAAAAPRGPAQQGKARYPVSLNMGSTCDERLQTKVALLSSSEDIKAYVTGTFLPLLQQARSLQQQQRRRQQQPRKKPLLLHLSETAEETPEAAPDSSEEPSSATSQQQQEQHQQQEQQQEQQEQQQEEDVAAQEVLHPVNSLPLQCRRVKLYEVDGETGNWIDRGTGHFYVEDGDSPEIPERDTAAAGAAATGSKLIVQEEETDAFVVESLICSNSLYQHQKESIITWQEGRRGDRYRALSFQHSHGCFALWTYIYLLSPDCCAGSMSDEEAEEEDELDTDAAAAAAAPDGSAAAAVGAAGGRAAAGVGGASSWLQEPQGDDPERPTRVLETPTVSSLPLLVQRVEYDLQHPQGSRQLLQDVRNRHWLRAFFALMRELMKISRGEETGAAEADKKTPDAQAPTSSKPDAAAAAAGDSLTDAPAAGGAAAAAGASAGAAATGAAEGVTAAAASDGLKQMAFIIRKMLVAWAGQIEALEVFLSREFWLDVLQCLEFEEDLASQGMSLPHTAFFKRVQFRQVLPLPQQHQQQELFLQHVHLHYRLTYLRDVALTRYVDEASIAQLQSLLLSNGHTIICLLSQSSPLQSPSSPQSPSLSPSNAAAAAAAGSSDGDAGYSSSSGGGSALQLLKARLGTDYYCLLFFRELLSLLQRLTSGAPGMLCSPFGGDGSGKVFRSSPNSLYGLFHQIKNAGLLLELKGYLRGDEEALKMWNEVILPINKKAEAVRSFMRSLCKPAYVAS